MIDEPDRTSTGDDDDGAPRDDIAAAASAQAAAPSTDHVSENETPDGAVPVGAEPDGQRDDGDDLRLFPQDGDAAPAAPDEESILVGLEALLFSTHHPLTAGRLAELLSLPTTKSIRRAIAQLNEAYQAGGRSFRIEQVAGGYQMLTLPELGELIKKLVQKEADARLTKAALETLAIIAYKQPILRVDVEAIRGVACGEAIRGLMEKHLVKIAGRAEEPGRPILYGTTKRFLEVFGLNGLQDLPSPEQGLKPKPPAPEPEPAGVG